MTQIIRIVSILILLCICSCSWLQHKSLSEVHHVVVIWLKPEYQEAEYITELKQAMADLEVIPGLNKLEYGSAIASDRPIVDDGFDLAVLMTFKDEETMRTYIDHPRHKNFVGKFILGKVTKLLIYDF